MSSDLCPYCLIEITKASKDHIFNKFLGGKTTIRTCVKCNNKFGQTFEGKVAIDTLHKLYISIKSWGLPLELDIPAWGKALEYNGLEFDLIIKDDSVQPQLSKPIVEKDESGEIVAISYSSYKEAEKALEKAKKRGKAPNGIIGKFQTEIYPFQVPLFYQIDINLMKFVIKMCMALATKLPNYNHYDTALGRMVLMDEKSPQDIVSIAFENYPQLDNLREPLSHVVYVERNSSQIIGVVQLFGVIQLRCFLGRCDKRLKDTAIIGTLDSITKSENFKPINPILKLPTETHPFPDIETSLNGSNSWSRKFEQSAKARGAENEVRLEGKIEIGKYHT